MNLKIYPASACTVVAVFVLIIFCTNSCHLTYSNIKNLLDFVIQNQIPGWASELPKEEKANLNEIVSLNELFCFGFYIKCNFGDIF